MGRENQERQQEQKETQQQGIDLARDEFGHSPIQEEGNQPIEAAGGLVTPSDLEAPGGSGSMHTHSQSNANARHRQPGSAHLDRQETSLSRGQAFDEAQGGGRGPDDVD